MGLFGWLTRKSNDVGTRAWREAWAAAVAALDTAAVDGLEAALRQQPPLADDVEMEEEMLDALKQLLAVERDLAGGSLPLIETTHRVVGADRCHFSAPVSMPDDPSQPTGPLLLTSSRAVFAGGSRQPALPWHGVREVIQSGRDLIFVLNRPQPEDGQRYRCNSYSDALCGAAIARYLSRQARTRPL
jgi:hypothetical protein